MYILYNIINIYIYIYTHIYIYNTHTVSPLTLVVTLARPRQHFKPTIPELLTWDTMMSWATAACSRFIVDRKVLKSQVRLFQDIKPLKHQN